MSYWIYNMGMPLQASGAQSANRRKVQPTSNPAKNDGATLDEQQMQDSTAADLAASRANLAYHNDHTQNRQLAYQASQIMSSPVFTLKQDVLFSQAWQQFEQKGFRHVVITDDSNKVVGILSDRDLLKQAASVTLSGDSKAAKQTVGQFMTATVLSATGDTRIQEVCQVMFNQHIGALPIVSHGGDLQGIVTRSDILRSMINNGPLELWI